MRIRIILLLLLLVYCHGALMHSDKTTVKNKVANQDTCYVACYSREVLNKILSDSTLHVVVDTVYCPADSVACYRDDMWLSETTYTVKYLIRRP